MSSLALPIPWDAKAPTMRCVARSPVTVRRTSRDSGTARSTRDQTSIIPAVILKHELNEPNVTRPDECAGRALTAGASAGGRHDMYTPGNLTRRSVCRLSVDPG